MVPRACLRTLGELLIGVHLREGRSLGRRVLLLRELPVEVEVRRLRERAHRWAVRRRSERGGAVMIGQQPARLSGELGLASLFGKEAECRPKGFFGSLFDYSFRSFITSRIIKVLYVLTTIVVALWTLAVILIAFKASPTLGGLTLLIGGPLLFVITMIYARVGLELLMVIFRIHENVEEINQRAGGASSTPVATVPPPTEPAPRWTSA